MRPTRILVLAALAVVGATASPARAHDLIAKVTFTATELKVVAAYDDDTPAEEAKVTLSVHKGAEVAKGVLDAKGVWTTPLPPPGKYVIVVRDGGHRDTKEFTIEAPAPAATEPVVEMTYERWRIDKTLGLSVGLGLLLGGTLLYVLLRRRRSVS
ncbi:hypothetical protein [Urbifossiella limnaea]|uniref:Carboxypeptidase regulatory-like domain-containing protein n=1 Tax=Urbifossiella limnaea TaxID=2528023 RepID=A0A517XRZ8_9BACT|nr:hypothetical protein [Urbifossiella limnaea]QDU20287.1 hypothetical protein ETAA1_22340 [Urbifossiella limnaea]